jgi:crotonobetainyl-CoA:carnitine CoA-transferase CaiB-like acyl-CoA transferase
MDVPHPDIPDLRLVDLPLKIGKQRGVRRTPPPRLGQHSDEILISIGYRPDEDEELRNRKVIR